MMKPTIYLSMILCLWIGITSIPVSAQTFPFRKDTEMFTPLEWQPKLRNFPSDANNNYVTDSLENIPTGAADVLVYLNKTPRASTLASLRAYGVLGFRAKYISIVKLRKVPVDSLLALGQHPDVAMVDVDWPVYPTLDVSTKAMKVYSSTEYANNLEDKCPGSDGTGVGIAIIDTGVDDGQHESLPGSKFVGGYNVFTQLEGNPDDDIGHGTHVASTALGIGNGTTNKGVAPGANLIDIKVFSATQNPTTSQIIDGVEKCIQRRYDWGIKVINMSLGQGCSPTTCWSGNGDDALSYVVNRAVYYGMNVVVSAGNCGATPSSVICGNGPANRVGIPGTARDAITVANADDMGTVSRADDDIFPTSAIGILLNGDPKLDVAAYGTNILAAQHNTVSGYLNATGTSMAAPHVAGLAAIIHQATPGVTPSGVKQLLIQTVEDRGATGWDNRWGHGLVDAYATMDALKNTSGTDLKFNVYCGQSGNPTWWDSPDLYPANPAIQDGVPNTIHAEITNCGTQDAHNFSVRIGIYNFSNSDPDYFICQVPVSFLAAGNTITVMCNWTPSISTVGTVHACLKSEIVYAHDTDFSNNCAQHNVDITRTVNNIADFQFEVRNNQAQPIQVIIDPILQAGLDREWNFKFSKLNFFMEEGVPPEIVTVQATKLPASTANFDTATVHVPIIAVLTKTTGNFSEGDTVNIGGVTLQAVDGTTGLEDKWPLSDALKIAPTGDAGMYLVTHGFEDFGVHAVKVLDLQGRVVKTFGVRGEGSYLLDVSALADGLYLLQTDGSRGVKFVKW